MLNMLTSYIIPLAVFAAMLAILWRFYRSQSAPRVVPAVKAVGDPAAHDAETAST